MMHEINADILSNLNTGVQRTIILHGCNCFHTMGAGIAKYLKDKYPQIYTADCMTKRGDKDKLGTCSRAILNPNLHILNCYTQYNYGREKILYASYLAIEECCKQVVAIYDPSWEIRMPKIGCGLAGGDWNIVENIIKETLNKFNVLVYYK
jgi:O-acetyl-ADP-ribose deacetylase (regulator of RNase III)